MKKLSRTRVEGVLSQNGGKFFSCKFKKKNNKERKLHGRLGVTKYLTGAGKNKVQKQSNGLVTVWDRRLESYRSINIETMSELFIGGVKFKVN